MVSNEYVCDKCGKRFKSREQALDCESQEFQRGYDFNIGDFFRLKDNIFEFGYVVGCYPINHNFYPIIFKFNYYPGPHANFEEEYEKWCIGANHGEYTRISKNNTQLIDSLKERVDELIGKLEFDGTSMRAMLFYPCFDWSEHDD